MPTGYTAAVEDGTITEFDDFAWQCARAFGALIMMRDDPMSAPIPQKFEPTAEHVEMKNFMLDQLRISLPDMSGRYDLEPVIQNGTTWLADQIHEAERSLNYHTKARAEEIARTVGRNQWLADLRHSLTKRETVTP